jgi:hypothetical protein
VTSYKSAFGMASKVVRLLCIALSGLALGVVACGDATPEGPPEELSDPGPRDASVDQALSFDGVDDYASIGTARMPLIERDQTLMLWFMPKGPVGAAPAEDLQAMFSLRRSDWSGVTLGLKDGVPVVSNVYSDKDVVLAEAAVTLDAWHHMAVVLQAKSTELFIDGVSVAKGAEPGQNRTPIEAYVGTADGYTQPFHGLLDEVQVYPRSYSVAQIVEVAEGIRANELDPPVLYLSFNEQGGARCYDRSGLENHGELGDGVSQLMPVRESSGVPNKPRPAQPTPMP